MKTFFRIFLGLLMFCSESTGWAEALQKVKDQKLILSIGIGSYEDKRWPVLKYVDKDATAVYQNLKTNFDGGWLLTPSSTGKSVDKQSVLDAMERLEKENRSENDTVVIYFSGHGTLATGARPETGGLGLRKYLVTGDTQFNQPETGISLDEFLLRFQKLRSRRKALVIDSCYAGGGKAYLTPQILSILAQQKSGAMQEPNDSLVESAAIYTASAWAEEASESEKLGHGIYTYFLLEGFTSDLDGDGAVSLSEAHQYASNRVIAYTKNSQHPTAKVEFVGKDPVIVNGTVTKTGASILYAWQWTLRKYEVLVNKSPVGNLQQGALPIPDGKHHLLIVDPETKRVVLDRFIDFEKGKDYSLSELFISQPEHHLTLGPATQQFLGRDLRERWSPRPWSGWQLNYRQDEAVWGWDLRATAGQFQSRQQQVVIDLEDDAIGLNRDTTEQDITAQKLSVGLGRHREVPLLSMHTRGIQTDWEWSVGAEALRIKRRLNVFGDGDFQEQESVPGIFAGMALHSVFLYPHIDLRLAWDFEVLHDAFLDRSLATSSSLNLAVGSSW